MPLQGNPKGAYMGAPLVKETAADSYGTHYDFNGVGGYFGVPTLADLYTIPYGEILNEDGYSSGQRRLGMRVRITTTTDRGREFVLDIPGYENLTPSQQVSALSSNTAFVEVAGAGTADLSGFTGDVTFAGSTSTIGNGKVTAAKISADLKSPAANVEGLRSLGTGANQAAPGSALANYVLKVAGYGLSQQNYTAAEKLKLSGLPSNPIQKIVFNGVAQTTAADGTVTFNSPTAAAGAAATTASNEGSTMAYGVFLQKTAQNLEFRKLLPGDGIDISYDSLGNILIRTSSAIKGTTPGTGTNTNVTPPAPYFLAYDDVANTYTFTPNGYGATEYVYSILGAAPVAATSNIVPIGDITLEAGQLEIYIPAGTGRNRGLSLYNAQRFTPAVAANITPTKPTFSGFDDTANVVYLSHPDYPVSELLYDLPNGAGSGLTLPSDGKIQVGNVAGQVIGYVRSATGRNQGLKEYSPAFTVTSATIYTATQQTYTTTAADYQAKCGKPYDGTYVGNSASNSSATSLDSQVDANTKALAAATQAAKDAITCQLSTPVYNTTLSLATPYADGIAFSVQTANGTEKIKFDLIQGTSGTQIDFNITTSAGTCYMTYDSEYREKPYLFIDANNTVHQGTFPLEGDTVQAY
jgi:hypothetical protein